ncbi:MAG: hypothetical protein ACLR1T_03385 [Evtepia gabavorous]
MTSFLRYCVNTLGYLRLMTVSDLIDIAILSFLFYKCIGIFQRTNAAKVATGAAADYRCDVDFLPI